MGIIRNGSFYSYMYSVWVVPGTSGCLDSSGCVVLSGWTDPVTFTDKGDRCLGDCRFCPVTFYLYEFIQYAASDAKPGEDRYECAADGINGSTRFPGRDMAVVDRSDIFGVGIGMDVQGFESVL